MTEDGATDTQHCEECGATLPDGGVEVDGASLCELCSQSHLSPTQWANRWDENDSMTVIQGEDER
jgi:recombinational DNA repair protein (RecF pathway)